METGNIALFIIFTSLLQLSVQVTFYYIILYYMKILEQCYYKKYCNSFSEQWPSIFFPGNGWRAEVF